jgi:hypothetical protein
VLSALAGAGVFGRSSAVGALPACTTDVHAVTFVGTGSLTIGYFPADLHLVEGNPANIGLGDSSSPVHYAGPGGSPTLELDRSSSSQPLGWEQLQDGGRSKWIESSAQVQGRRALVLIGAIDHGDVVVTWHATPATELIVQASGLPEAQVLAVARHLAFRGPGLVPLPLSAGRIISSGAAIRAAKPAAGGRAAIGARLTSLAEIEQLRQRIPPRNRPSGMESVSSGRVSHKQMAAASGVPEASPWQPVWAVLLSKPADELVLVDPHDGHVLERAPVSSNEEWFGAITNRDPSIGGCPGGSTARVPFGILTRSEEEAPFVAHQRLLSGRGRVPVRGGGTATTYFTLASAATLDHRNIEGCGAACLRERLVWVAMTVTTSRRGSPAACPLGGGEFERHQGSGQLHPARTVYEFSYGSGAGVICGHAPTWWAGLHDLAPPSSGNEALHLAGVSVAVG